MSEADIEQLKLYTPNLDGRMIAARTTSVPSWVFLGDLEKMLASAPEVGEAVDMDENTAKRFRGILSLLGISAPESDESLILCQFPLLGMMRHKIQQIYDQPDRTAQLEADKARLVEVKSELVKVREQLYKVSGSALLAGEKCKKEDAGILYNIVCTANNTLSYIETLIAEMEAKG